MQQGGASEPCAGSPTTVTREVGVDLRRPGLHWRHLGFALLESVATLAAVAVVVTALITWTLAHVDAGRLPFASVVGPWPPFEDLSLLEAVAVGVSRSAILVVPALIVSLAIGLLSAITYVATSSPWLRTLLWSLASIGASLPPFFWAFLMYLTLLFVATRTGVWVLPSFGLYIQGHPLLPIIALTLRPAAAIFLAVTAVLEEVQHGEFIRAARARGLSEQRLVAVHALPNSAATALSAVNSGLFAIVSALPIIEYIFWWDGAGFGFIHALAIGDVDAAAAFAVLFAVVLALSNFASAVMAQYIDPRMRR